MANDAPTGTPTDATPAPKPLDAAHQPAPKNDTLSTLGGDLLTNPAAGAAKAVSPEQQAYDQAHGAYMKQVEGYWKGVSDGKASHHYVMDFPPIYTGPEKPKVAGQPPEAKPNNIATLNQLIDATKQLNVMAGESGKGDFHLGEISEADFKRRYAEEAVAVGKAHGVGKDEMKEIVRSIYAFEDGGWGTHETLSSMPQALTKPDAPGETTIQDARRNFHLEGPTASSALGYNQLLMGTTLAKFDQQSTEISDRLTQLAKDHPERAAELQEKAKMVADLGKNVDAEIQKMLQEEMAKPADQRKHYLTKEGTPNEDLYRDFGRSTELTASGVSRRDMARALHGLNMDGDIGPVVQGLELGNLMNYADKNNYASLLKGTETAGQQDVARYDALPAADKAAAVGDIMKQIQPPAFSANPLEFAANSAQIGEFALAKSDLEQKLMALKNGDDSALAKENLDPVESKMVQSKLLTIKAFSDPTGPFSENDRLLLNKIAESYYGGLTADKLMPAALEAANLMGPIPAARVLDVANKDVPTPNFFSEAGYYANPVAKGRTASELTMQIENSMQGPNKDPLVRPGQADFELAFDQL